MRDRYLLTIVALVLVLSGCANPRQSSAPGVESSMGRAAASRTALETPLEVKLAKPGSSLETMKIRSGQLIALDINYCPPIELRDASGMVVFELKGGTRPQKLFVSPGAYTLVGHTPVGREWARQIVVTKD